MPAASTTAGVQRVRYARVLADSAFPRRGVDGVSTQRVSVTIYLEMWPAASRQCLQQCGVLQIQLTGVLYQAFSSLRRANAALSYVTQTWTLKPFHSPSDFRRSFKSMAGVLAHEVLRSQLHQGCWRDRDCSRWPVVLFPLAWVQRAFAGQRREKPT